MPNAKSTHVIFKPFQLSLSLQKALIMNAAEIKIDLFRKLDSLKGNKLEEAYGILINYINGKSEVDDWQNLTPEQQAAIKLGIDQLNNGEGRSHRDLMSDLRRP